MKVQEHIAQDGHGARAPVAWYAVAKDTAPNLTLAHPIAYLREHAYRFLNYPASEAKIAAFNPVPPVWRRMVTEPLRPATEKHHLDASTAHCQFI